MISSRPEVCVQWSRAGHSCFGFCTEQIVSIFSVSAQNMVAYVTLVIVIFVLVYSLIIGEVAVTFPDTSCFIPC